MEPSHTFLCQPYPHPTLILFRKRREVQSALAGSGDYFFVQIDDQMRTVNAAAHMS